MLKFRLMSSVFSMLPIDSFDPFVRLCSAEGDGGGGDGGGDAAAAAAAAAAAGEAKAEEPSTLLGTAKAPAEGEKKDDATKDDAAAAAAAVAGDKKDQAETPEQKAERLKNETPEQKVEREKVEKAEADKKTAEVLKTYEAIKMPEGVNKDQPAVQDFLKVAAEDGMPLEKAQRLVDSVAPKLQAAVDAPYKAWADVNAQWVTELKTDMEIGGDKLKENLGLAAKAIDTYSGAAATPEGKAVRDALEFTGAGNNPAIVRMLVKVGKALAEGGPLGGNNKPSADLAAMMYPNMGAKS